jgi:glycosyltransferase involved in cell wall biosynthesis
MTADTIGGVWTYATELSRALQAHNVEVALAMMGALPTADQRREAAQLENVTLFESDYALEWMDGPWDEVDRAGEWLLGIESEFRPDIIHLNGYAHASLSWHAPVVVVAHSCVLSWWSAVKREPAPDRYGEYRRRVSDGLFAADLVVAPTAAMLRSLSDHYVPVGRREVIPNGRDAAGFKPASKQPSIFTCGRAWDEAKNIAALDAVAEDLAWPVELAGDCRHPNGTNVQPQSLTCIGRIDIDALKQRMAAASIFALPARYEPFGLSALEAALSGCALVLGDIETQREVWGDAATFVDPDDHDALARALNDLIHDDRRRGELGRRARARALEFSPAKMATRYLAAYSKCIANRRPEVAA